MKRKAYPSDLSDAEWKLLKPHIPKAKPEGRPREHPMREIMNGIYYVLKADGCFHVSENSYVAYHPFTLT